MTTPRYLSFRDLRARGITFTRKHVLTLMREGRFPLARQISSNRVAWIEDEIESFLANRPVSRALSEGTGHQKMTRRAPVPR
jgi:predicted DNA-binding transcriptional regulator AlpA